MNSYADQTITSSFMMWSINELCEFKRGEIITKKTANLEGTIPVVSSGIEPSYYHDKFNREGLYNKTIFYLRNATSNISKVFITKNLLSDALSVTSTDKNILLDNSRLYQVFKNRQEKIYSYQTGAAQKMCIQKILKIFKFHSHH